MAAGQDQIEVGQTTSFRAVAIMSDGSRRSFPAGTLFTPSLADPTVASIGQPFQNESDVIDLTAIRGAAISDVNVSVKTPGPSGQQFTPTAPHASLIVIPHPATEPTITGVELRPL